MNAKEKWIEDRLSSLDGLKKAEANPYLYSKVMNRMEKKDAKELRLNPSIVWSMAACVLVVLSINVFTLLHFSKATTEMNSNVVAQEYFSYTKNLPIL